MMRILITGNMGYVGPVLGRFLRAAHPDAELIGVDAGFFGHSLTGADQLPEADYDRQIMADVRTLDSRLLDGVDAVVHLAALSNDAMGQEYAPTIDAINRAASLRLARLAARAGVKAFVFASSCAMYGAAVGPPRKERHPVNPLTAYARSKIGAEVDLRSADLGEMIVTSLRFATACGMSERLRLDTVLNDFVACAVTGGVVAVLADGSAWRSLIDVEDMARAIDWAIGRGVAQGGTWLAVNVGRSENTCQVRDLARAVQRVMPETRVAINHEVPSDKRSYQVDFALFRRLAPAAQPVVSIDQSVARLVGGLARMRFTQADSRSSPYVRLVGLRQHIAAGRLGQDLRWVRRASRGPNDDHLSTLG
jgi:nucleoside-diphosphate-sugar epimerase